MLCACISKKNGRHRMVIRVPHCHQTSWNLILSVKQAKDSNPVERQIVKLTIRMGKNNFLFFANVTHNRMLYILATFPFPFHFFQIFFYRLHFTNRRTTTVTWNYYFAHSILYHCQKMWKKCTQLTTSHESLFVLRFWWNLETVDVRWVLFRFLINFTTNRCAHVDVDGYGILKTPRQKQLKTDFRLVQ